MHMSKTLLFLLLLPGLLWAEPSLSVFILTGRSYAAVQQRVISSLMDESEFEAGNLDSYAPNQPINIGFVAQSAEQVQKPSAVVFDLAFLNPEGKELFSQKNFAQGDTRLSRGSFVGSPAAFDLVMKKSDPAGVYKIRVTARDTQTGASGQKTINLTYKNSTNQFRTFWADFNSLEELSDWATFYYRHPEPERVLPSMYFFAHTKYAVSPDETLPWFVFYGAIFEKNPALAQDVFNQLDTQNDYKERVVFIKALSFVPGVEAKALVDTAIGKWFPSARATFRSWIEENQIPYPLQVRANSEEGTVDVELLWARYFATGDEAIVRKFISLLHLVKSNRNEEIIVGGAVTWLLTANAIQHPAVFEACKKALPGTSGITAERLMALIQNASNPVNLPRIGFIK